jgi:hypothetical protein
MDQPLPPDQYKIHKDNSSPRSNHLKQKGFQKIAQRNKHCKSSRRTPIRAARGIPLNHAWAPTTWYSAEVTAMQNMLCSTSYFYQAFGTWTSNHDDATYILLGLQFRSGLSACGTLQRGHASRHLELRSNHRHVVQPQNWWTGVFGFSQVSKMFPCILHLIELFS